MQIKDKGLLGLNSHHCSRQRWLESEPKRPFSLVDRFERDREPAGQVWGLRPGAKRKNSRCEASSTFKTPFKIRGVGGF